MLEQLAETLRQAPRHELFLRLLELARASTSGCRARARRRGRSSAPARARRRARGGFARAAGRSGRTRQTCGRASRSRARARTRRGPLPRRARGGSSPRGSRPRPRRLPASPTSSGRSGRGTRTSSVRSRPVEDERARRGAVDRLEPGAERGEPAQALGVGNGGVGRRRRRQDEETDVAQRRVLRRRAPAGRRRRRGRPPCRRTRARADDSSPAIRSRRSSGALEVAAAKVAGALRRAVRGVRHADPELEQGELLVRLEEPRREAGVVQQAPEVVARVREMRAGRRRDASGVDPAEDDREPRREHVGHVARRAERRRRVGTHGCDCSCECSRGGSRTPQGAFW